MRSIHEIKKNDSILACFPKVGSTWVRYFLFNLLCDNFDNTTNQNIDLMNEKMPEFANRSFFKNWEFERCNRIIKTHQRFYPFFKNKPVLLLIRDPRDVMVSFYKYASSSNKYNYDKDISEMIIDRRMGFESYMKHYSSWRNEADLIIKFEDLKKEPEKYFAHIAQFYGINATVSEISLAVKKSNITNMKIAERNSKKLSNEFSNKSNFIRSGSINQWEDFFTKDEIDLFNELCEKYEFNYYASYKID